MNAKPDLGLPTRDEISAMLKLRFDNEISEITKIYHVSYSFAHGLAAGMQIMRDRMKKKFSAKASA